MKITIDDFKTGWVGLSLAFRPQEIDLFIERLAALRSGNAGHFHCHATDFEGENGVADVEVSLMGEQEVDNLAIE